ncbi:integrase-like protein [Actinocrispum wychmicini]|uniref:Integrase-like protein n=1 Tax=Actinocrispum wychmicini TaxID=1213861 RepID=A0A4R2JHB2_9PSEU|nr:integrase-like protein [Actinocrispum wychmicini]
MSWVEHTSGQHWRVRYRRPGGFVASEGGFTDQQTAETRAHEIDDDRQRRAFRGLTGSRTTVDEWLVCWWTTLNVDETTLDNYHYLVGKHIAPRFGILPLRNLRSSDINRWSIKLHDAGYEHSTVEGIVSLFRRILGDAVEDGLLPVNPIHPHHNRGKRAFHIQHEMLWATPEEVLRAAQQAERLHNRTSALLIITAAWTGCRWGELAGLQRLNTHPDDRVIVIDPDVGALKETAHRQWLGPPKTPASARTVTLPVFLAVLLKHHLATHDPLGRLSQRLRRFPLAAHVAPTHLQPCLRRQPHPTTPHRAPLPHPARPDIPRTQTQPQDLAHRRRHPRNRPSPTTGPPPRQACRGGLQPRRRRSRSPHPSRPQTRLARRTTRPRRAPSTTTGPNAYRTHPPTPRHRC